LPYDYKQLPSLEMATSGFEGYELAPVTGLFSIVSPTGVVTNLNDLSTKVLAYLGAGMPPIENITTPLGVLGGSYVQGPWSGPAPLPLAAWSKVKPWAKSRRLRTP
jgi:hypothetical protein